MTTTPAGFPVHSLATVPDASRPTAEALHRAFGGVLPNLFGVLAESPAALDASAQLSAAVGATSLTALEQQVIELAVSRQNECEYCLAAHSFLGRLLPQGPLVAAREGQRIDDPKLETLRLFSVELVARHGLVSDATRARFREVGYSDRQALEVMTVVTLKTLHNLANNYARTPIDPVFAQHLAQSRAQNVTARP